MPRIPFATGSPAFAVRSHATDTFSRNLGADHVDPGRSVRSNDTIAGR